MGLAIESSVTYSEIRQTVYFSLLGWRKPARSAGDWTAGLLQPGRLLHRPLRRWRGGRHWCSRRRRRIWPTASDGLEEEKQRRYLAFGIEQSYPSAAEGQIRRRCRRHRSRQVEKDEQRARQARVRAFFDLELNTLSYRPRTAKTRLLFSVGSFTVCPIRYSWFAHYVQCVTLMFSMSNLAAFSRTDVHCSIYVILCRLFALCVIYVTFCGLFAPENYVQVYTMYAYFGAVSRTM